MPRGQPIRGEIGFRRDNHATEDGLRLIADLPDTRERKQRELEVQIALAGALTVVKGYAHPEVAEASGRARNLESGARGADAEPHGLRSDLLWRLPSPEWTEVEGCFRSALAIARKQGTRGFELRAAVSLVRLLSDRSRRDEARDVLAPVYGWLTEGFGAPDLREAKAQLEALDA